MLINKKPIYMSIFSILIFFLVLFNIPIAQAAYDSNISIILFGDGTNKNGQLKLEFPKDDSDGTLTYASSGTNLIFHYYFPGEKYVGIEIIRDEKVIFSISANGDTKQTVFENAIKGLKVQDTDILHFYFKEPGKQEVNNFDQRSSLLSAQFRKDFQKDMYYIMTYGGFIPVNTGISHLIYDLNKKGVSGTQMSSLFSKNILNFGYSGEKKYDFFGTIESDMNFHSFFKGKEYYTIAQHAITEDHQLGSPVNTASALGDTTFSGMGDQLNKLSVMEGTIYRVFSAEPNKIRLWKDGIPRQVKNKSQKETYLELTKNQGLVELDFNRVKSKEVTIELGTKPEEIKIEDFINVADYPNLSSSFKTKVETDNVGTYDQEISIKQNLLTASNYFFSTVRSKVTIVDTTPPEAIGKTNVETPIYAPLPSNPAELLDKLSDNSKIEDLKVEYLNESGDTSVPGIKQVKIRITDASNNFTDVTVNVTIVPGLLTIKSVPSIHFGKIKIGELAKSISQNGESDAVMSVDDLRGTKAGWKLQASMSDFMDKDGKKINAQISLLKGILSNTDNKIDGLNTFDIILNNNLQTIVQAEQDSGMKNSTAVFKNEDISLINSSPDAKIGSYEATINWVLLDTP